jgi:hypothetical protein
MVLHDEPSIRAVAVRARELACPVFQRLAFHGGKSAAPISLILRAARLTLLVALSLAAIVTSCSQAPTVPTPSRSSPSAPVPPPAPTGPLTGVVFEATEQGRRPIPGAQVTVVDLVAGPYGFLGFIELATDANGRFALAPRQFSGRTVKLTAVLRPDLPWTQRDLFQTRAVHPTVPIVDADTVVEVEIELVPRGVQPRTLDSPVLSGVVFESTAEGLRPAVDMPVYYSSNNHDGADVYGRTDADGRYRFWNIPVGGGYLLPACWMATTRPPDQRVITFPIDTFPVDVRGDTILDARCP